MKTAPPSHRKRFTAGLALGAALVAGIVFWQLGRARSWEEEQHEERVRVIALQALASEVQAAGVTGDLVRQVVARAGAGHSLVRAIRVVVFDGLMLEASTASSDTGEQAAPRKLAREEKPLYDQGQRLRAAVETNREEGVARKDEIEIDRAPDGVLVLSAPLEQDGAVVGMAQIVTERPAVRGAGAGVAAPGTDLPRATGPTAPALGRGLFAALLAFAAPLAVFVPLSFLIGERRLPLALLASLLLAASAVAYVGRAAAVVTADRRASEEAIAAAVGEEAKRSADAFAALALPKTASLDPASWDADRYRRPRGIVSRTGGVASEQLGAAIGAVRKRWTQVGAGVAALALALLAFVGLGGASSLFATLVKFREAYAYTLPAMLGMLVLVFFPFLYGIALSFTDQNIYNTGKPISEIFVGVKNFVDILGDFAIAKHTPEGLVLNYQNFYWTLFVTVAWTIANVSIGVSVGLLLALVLNTKGLALRPVYRVLLILPWAMPNYITALIWKGMFHQQFGVINQVIQVLGGSPISWFEKPLTAFTACVATNGWLSFPFMMVISLGALQSIPADLYEAARVDGATRWQQFRSITLPSLKPALVPAVILSVVWTFNMFNIIYLVSGGDPAHSTEILVTQAYKLAFEQYRYGYAAAYSTVIFGILLVYGVWQNRVTKATEGL